MNKLSKIIQQNLYNNKRFTTSLIKRLFINFLGKFILRHLPQRFNVVAREMGFTFVEVLIGILLIAIVLGGILEGFYLGSYTSKNISLRSNAILLAQQLMEEIKSKQYEDIDPYDHNSENPDIANTADNDFLGPETNDDKNNSTYVEKSEFDDIDDFDGYTDIPQLDINLNVNSRAVTVIGIGMDNSGNYIDIIPLTVQDYANINYKKIQITVSWTWKGKDYSETLITSVSPRTAGL